MSVQGMKALASTMLSMMLLTVSIESAIAQETEQIQQAPSPTGVTTTQPVTGTVTAVTGNVVTVRTLDGATRQITLRQEELTRLSLQPGVQIAFTLDEQNIASNVSIVQANPTTTGETGTTGVNTTTQQPGTTQTTTEETITTPTTTTAPATTTETDTTEVETAPATTTEDTTDADQATEAPPVRALW